MQQKSTFTYIFVNLKQLGELQLILKRRYKSTFCAQCRMVSVLMRAIAREYLVNKKLSLIMEVVKRLREVPTILVTSWLIVDIER